MASITDIQNPEDVVSSEFNLRTPSNRPFRVRVQFYANAESRAALEKHKKVMANGHGVGEDGEPTSDLTDFTEAQEDEPARLRGAREFCKVVKSIDTNGTPLSGPLLDGDGNTIVQDGEPIPITPEMMQWVETWLRSAITDRIAEIIFPSLKELRKLRQQ